MSRSDERCPAAELRSRALVDGAYVRLQEIQALVLELQLHVDTEEAPTVWLKLLAEAARLSQLAEIGLHSCPASSPAPNSEFLEPS